MRVARLWLVFGVVSLLLSGALSMLITGAKMPFFKPYVTDLELIRRSLVIHVNLATLVWFSAIPVALTRMVAWGDRCFNWKDAVGLVLSIVGIALMAASAFFPASKAVLANYIPVLTHPMHDWGLGLFFTGVALTYLSPQALFLKADNRSQLKDWRFGLWVGGLYFLFACAALVLAFPALSRSTFVDHKTYFEIGMWGGGHLLQHASSVFLLVCWSFLLRHSGLKGGILDKENGKWIFALMAIPLTMLPFIFLLAPWSNEYREAFTSLMRWGIAPPIVIFLVGVFWLIAGRRGRALSREQKLSRATWGLSSLLILLGFAFGALINGPDLRVPGHYHATIGAVTIAFLLVSYRLLFGLERDHEALKPAIWCYGIGQSLFSGGMFTAGAFGLGRKTYGAEHILTNWGQITGMAVLGLGGLIALAGGILFAVAVYGSWKRVAQPHSRCGRSLPHLALTPQGGKP